MSLVVFLVVWALLMRPVYLLHWRVWESDKPTYLRDRSMSVFVSVIGTGAVLVILALFWKVAIAAAVAAGLAYAIWRFTPLKRAVAMHDRLILKLSEKLL